MLGRAGAPLLVFVCLFLSGCQRTSTGQQAHTTATPQKVSGKVPHHAHRQPSEPVVWTIAATSGPASIDPADATDPAAIDICQLLYQGLVRINYRLQVVPAAAASWTKSRGGLHYVFRLKSGLRFSNGRLVTAGDVVGSFIRALGPASSNGIMANYLDELKRSRGKPDIFAVGPNEVGFDLSRRSPEFLTKLAFVGASIVDMATVHRYGALWTSHVDGLGPFRIIAAHTGGAMTLGPNPFFRPRPRLSRLTVDFLPSHKAVEAFAEGHTNVVSGLQGSNRLESRFPGRFHSATSAALDYLVLNTRSRPLQKADIRRGIALSVNRAQLTSRVFGSSAVPVGSVVPPPLLPEAFAERHDPSQALRQITLSGHPFAAHLPHFRFVFPKTRLEEKRAKLLESMWIHVLGMPVSPVALPPAGYAAAIRARHFDIALVRWGAEYPDAADFLDKQLYGGAPDNFSGWVDRHFDGLINASRRQGVDTPQRRQDLLGAAQIAATQAPWIPLDSPLQGALVSPGLRGLAMTPEGLMGWANASTSEGFLPGTRF